MDKFIGKIMLMLKKKKVEIFIEALYKDFIVEILHTQGVKDFLCLPIIEGSKQSNEDFISNLWRICIVIILEKDAAKEILKKIKPLLKQPQGIILLSDVDYVFFKEDQ